MEEFKINELITLKLKDNKTLIYVGGEEFKQCKYLLLNIPIEKVSSFKEIKSIDEAKTIYNKELEKDKSIADFHIAPEQEFWAHCSNLQVWHEKKYDTNILHSNLAFPLLEKLVELGDPLAKNIFKEEIVKRVITGYSPVIDFLMVGKYIKILNDEELKTLIYDLFSKKKIVVLIKLFRSKYFNVFNEIEIKSLLKENEDLLKNLENEDFRSYLSEIFQHITLMTIKKQFFGKDEVYAEYKDIIKPKHGIGLVRNINILIIQSKQHYNRNSKELKRITYLTELTRLRISQVNINNINNLAFLKGLKNLNELSIEHCNIRGIKYLGLLKKLHSLYLGYNEITEIKGLETLKNLKTLTLMDNQITEIKGLKNLTELEYLHLSNNQITEIKGLDTLKKLNHLDLSNNQITGIKGLKNLTELKHLDLSHNQITEIKGLETLKKLNWVGLYANKIKNKEFYRQGFIL